MRSLKCVLSAIAAVLAAAASPAAAQGPPANVRVAPATMEVLSVPRAVTGEIVTLRRSLLASQVEGLIIELDVNEGDAVARGDVIARLDGELARLDVVQAEAELAAARGLVAQREAELARYRNDLERVRTLSSRGGTTASEIDGAEADVQVTEALAAQARAGVSAAESALSRARKDLADKTILAPFNGRVVLKQADLGEWVTPGDTIVDLVSMDQLEARIDVPEHLVGYLGREQGAGTITVSVPGLGDRGSLEARLIGVIPLGDSLSRMFTARLALLEPESEAAAGERAGLKPGMSVTAFVPTSTTEPVLTIPKDAVLRDDAGEYVYMAVPHSVEGNPMVTAQAIPARITRRFAAGDRVAIRPGQIQPGSYVLVEGNERVYPTQGLSVQDPPADSPFAGDRRGAPPSGAQRAPEQNGDATGEEERG